MALLMRQVPGFLNGLGDLQDRLHGALIAGKQSGLPESTYQNLLRASDLLVTVEDYLPGNPDTARARFVDAQRLFQSEERTCADRNPAYCSKFGVETFANLFRQESARISRNIEGSPRNFVAQGPTLEQFGPGAVARHGSGQANKDTGSEDLSRIVLIGAAVIGGLYVLSNLFKAGRAIGTGAGTGVRAARAGVRAAREAIRA